MAVGKRASERSGRVWAGVWTIVVAAGAGNRFGGPKQFSPLGNRCVLDWVVRTATHWSEGVVVVLPKAGAVGADAWQPPVAGAGEDAAGLSASDAGEGVWRPSVSDDCASRVVAVAGGVLRSDSVRCGLSAVPDDAEIVLVHDGARPLAGDAVFERVIAAVRGGADAAVPVVGLVDTVRWRAGGRAG